MKANELMIGDWVYNKNIDKPMQVYPMMLSQMFRSNPDATTEDYNIFPIHLTPEILEKNGFKRSDNGDNKYVSGEYAWGYLGVRNFTVVSITFYEGLSSGVKILTKIETDSSHDSGINQVHSCDIEFVHQIQHALALSGINKEIIM